MAFSLHGGPNQSQPSAVPPWCLLQWDVEDRQNTALLLLPIPLHQGWDQDLEKTCGSQQDGETSSGALCCGIGRATPWQDPMAGRAAPPQGLPPQRMECKQAAREGVGRRGRSGERSPEREVGQVSESTALAQFKWPERSSERRG